MKRITPGLPEVQRCVDLPSKHETTIEIQGNQTWKSLEFGGDEVVQGVITVNLFVSHIFEFIHFTKQRILFLEGLTQKMVGKIQGCQMFLCFFWVANIILEAPRLLALVAPKIAETANPKRPMRIVSEKSYADLAKDLRFHFGVT